MKKSLLLLFLFFFPVYVSFSQVNHTGNVELIDMSDDSSILTFSVEGVAARKGDVEKAAKETLFYKLLYEGVEGVNEGEKLIQHEKKYWLDNFFEGKNNVPYNRYIKGIEQEGAVVKEGNDYKGTYNIVLNMKGLIKELKLNGIRDGGEVRSARPKKAVGIEALKEAERKKKEEEKAERERQLEQQRQQELESQKRLEQQQRPQQPVAKSSKLQITKDGVGPVKFGSVYTIPDVLNRCKLPEKYDQLYDKLYCDRNQFSGDFEIEGELAGQPALYVFCDEKDRVSCFAVTTPNVETAEGLSINNTAGEIQAAGATVEKKSLYDGKKVMGYQYALSLNGLYFVFGEADVSAAGIKNNAKPLAISSKNFWALSDYLPISFYL